jgi:hypothetical protein
MKPESIRIGESSTIEERERHINTTIKVLKEQVNVFTSRLQPHDTGHLHTTIGTLNHRIKELEKERSNTSYTFELHETPGTIHFS